MANQQIESGFVQLDTHHSASANAQWAADKWMITGTVFMGTAIFGFIGFPFFLYGLHLQMQAAKAGQSVRPLIVTLIGYLVIMDSSLNSIGWCLDMVANHSIAARTFQTAWGAMFDGGYFWHYNETFLGGTAAPGEKAWEIALIPIVFCGRIAAAIGLLQMKRWGQQWLIVTCWMGVIVWVGYNSNMTIYADIRYSYVTWPVLGWWLYDIWFITPFLALPYLHTVNREIFSE